MSSSAPSKQLQLVKRTAFGTKGKQTRVTVNCVEVTRKPDGLVQHYDVKWSADIEEKRLYMKWLLQKNKALGEDGVFGVYDGKANLYVLSRTAMPSKTFPINESEARALKEGGGGGGGRGGRQGGGGRGGKAPGGERGGKPLTVTITPAQQATVNMTQLFEYVSQRMSSDVPIGQQIAALNLVMKHVPADKFPSRLNTFYVPSAPNERCLLPGGVEAWRGFFTSMRPAIGKVLFVFDTAVAAFKEPGNLLEILQKAFRKNDIQGINTLNKTYGVTPLGDPKKKQLARNREIVAIQRFLKNLKITFGPWGPQRQVKIRKVSKVSATDYEFDVDEGTKDTVQRYLEKKYNKKLQHPYLPVVQVTRTAWIPMEWCSIVPGGSFYSKLEPEQVSELLKSSFVTMKPDKKLEILREGMKYLNLQNATSKRWNLDLAPTFMQVPARQLPPPVLSYKDQSGKEATVMPRDGQWDVRGKKAFSSGTTVERSIVVVFADNNGSPTGFPVEFVRQSVSGLITACTRFGITFKNQQPYIYHAGARVDQPDRAIIDASKGAKFGPQNPPQLVIVYLLKQSTNVYPEVKKACDLTLGVASQCMQIGKVKSQSQKGGGEQYYSNIALKINVKLCGINQMIRGGPPGFQQKPTIIFGADVTHPAPGSFLPSIAAVVASHDLQGTSYTTETRVQASKQGQAAVEIIQDLKVISKNLLQKFFKKTSKKPQRILFFRDGVSEGQFGEVFDKEVKAIQAACMELGGPVPITYVICAKRHHIRMFPLAASDADRSGNVKPGTIIDSEICTPYGNDYYLMSHAGLIGTSKPCHYTILLDENRLGPDGVQEMTNVLAYIYPRSTRSVSIVAPAYFAHHVATRARTHIGQEDEDAASSLGSQRTREQEDAERQRQLQIAREKHRAINPKLADTLYFM